MSKKKLLILILLVIVIVGAIVVYSSGMTSENAMKAVPETFGSGTTTGKANSSSSSKSHEQYLPYTNNAKGSVTSSGSTTPYIPVPIDRATLLSGRYTEHVSPDGKFIAHGFDNEQGDSGIYLTSSSGAEVTATYCGFFRDWAADSKKITVFVPYECGKSVSENETFELHVDGTISK